MNWIDLFIIGAIIHFSVCALFLIKYIEKEWKEQ